MPSLGTMVSPWHPRTRSSKWTRSLSSFFFRRGILAWNLVSMFKCNSWLLLGSWTMRGNDPPEGNPHPPPERDLASGPTGTHVFPPDCGLVLAVTWLWGRNCTSWPSESTADTRQSCLLDVSRVREGNWRAPLLQLLLSLASLLSHPPLAASHKINRPQGRWAGALVRCRGGDFLEQDRVFFSLQAQGNCTFLSHTRKFWVQLTPGFTLCLALLPPDAFPLGVFRSLNITSPQHWGEEK